MRSVKKTKASKKKKNGNGIRKLQKSNGGEASSSKGHYTHQGEQYNSNGSENIPLKLLHNDPKDFSKVVPNDAGGVLCARDMNTEQGHKSKDLKVFHIVSGKKLHNSNGYDDGESRVLEKYSLASENQSLSGDAEAYKPVVETKTIDANVPPEKSAHSDVPELGIQANDAQFDPSLLSLDKTGDSVTVIDIESKNEHPSKESGDKFLHSSDDPVLEISTCGDYVNDPEILECSEEEPQVAAAQQVQTTSWKSCCGFLEVLMGSK